MRGRWARKYFKNVYYQDYYTGYLAVDFRPAALIFIACFSRQRHFNMAQPFRATLGAHSKCPFVVPSEHKAIKNQLASPKKMQSTRAYAYAPARVCVPVCVCVCLCA